MHQDKKKFQLIFTGDLSLTGVFHQEILNSHDIFSNELTYTLIQADYCICNFEGPASQSEKLNNKATRIASPYNSIPFLVSKNIRVFNLANNHIFDNGMVGYHDTVDEINSNSAYFFGAGKHIDEASSPLYLKKDDLIIALIGISQHTGIVASKNSHGIFSEKEFNLLNKRVVEARQKANWIILNFHGGEEYTTIPSPIKRRFAKKLASIQGVDIVICHHSHVFQGIENYREKIIFYSLGNFVFDFETHHLYPFTQESALVSINFSQKSFDYELIPIKINNKNKCIELAEKKYIEHIKTISDFSHYWLKWMSEAERVLFRKPVVEAVKDPKRLQAQSPVKWLFQKKFYRQSNLILFDRHSRCLYLSALVNKIFR